MSGGDLDGDIYFVMWDPELVPLAAAEARDYSHAEVAPEQHEGVRVAHIVEFFADYIRNDQLSRIALGHLSLADESPYHAHDARCEELVRLHSTAVDFAKNGVPVNVSTVSRHLSRNIRPDYQGGPRRSTTAIGEITRRAKRRMHEVVQEEVEAGVASYVGEVVRGLRVVPRGADGNVVAAGAGQLQPYVAHQPEGLLDKQLLLIGRVEFRPWARRRLQEWGQDFAGLMRRFGVHDVGQVVTGRVLAFHGRAAGKEKQADHQVRLDRELLVLIEKTRHNCFPELDQSDEAQQLLQGEESLMEGPGMHPASMAPEPSCSHRGAVSLRAASGVATGAHSALASAGVNWHDERVVDRVLRKASAMYEVAYRTSLVGTAHDMSKQDAAREKLIWRAFPWRIAPRLLAEIKRSHSADGGLAAFV